VGKALFPKGAGVLVASSGWRVALLVLATGGAILVLSLSRLHPVTGDNDEAEQVDPPALLHKKLILQRIRRATPPGS